MNVILKVIQLFPVFVVNIMKIEKRKLRQGTFSANSFLWNSCSYSAS